MNLKIMKKTREFLRNRLHLLNRIKFIFTKINSMKTQLILLQKKKVASGMKSFLNRCIDMKTG